MMHGKKRSLPCLMVCVFLLHGIALATPEVTVMKTPNAGYRPQVVRDGAGTIHMVYTRMGKDAMGDLFYIRRKAGQEEFSKPIKVNSTPNCAAAFHMAIGKGGRAHVFIRANARYLRLFNKSKRLKLFDLKYMLYCRMNDAGTAFETERNLAGETYAFEGGGLLFPDGKGTIYAFWHGLTERGPERTRKIFMATSQDEGKNFTAGVAIQKAADGTCACCPLGGLRDEKGDFYISYRNSEISYRNSEASFSKDSYLLISSNQGKTFTETLLDPWAEAGCPGANYSITSGSSGAYVAWRTHNQVYFSKAGESSQRVAAPADGKKSRSPLVVANSKGQVLFAWAEGTGVPHFLQGGDLAWQIYDKDGKPVSKKQVLPARVAKWSTAAAYAKPNGDFVMFYDGPGLGE